MLNRYLFLFISLVLTGCSNHSTYHVQRGDSVYSISWRYGYHYKDVAAWNNIAPPYVIHEGQVLRFIAPEPKQNWTLLSKSRNTVSSSKLTAIGTSAGDRQDVTVATPKNVALTKGSPELHWNWPSQGLIRKEFSRELGSNGIDIGGSVGQAVVAAVSGRVVYSGNGLSGYGNLLILKHNEEYLSAYAYNQVLLVKEGDLVAAGQQIANMGEVRVGDGLLHFEIRREGQPVDPMLYLPRSTTEP